jgi:hypothetical protein
MLIWMIMVINPGEYFIFSFAGIKIKSPDCVLAEPIRQFFTTEALFIVPVDPASTDNINRPL